MTASTWRDRRTAHIAFAVVGVLAVAAIVFGVGVSSAVPKLSQVGAWLANPGNIVHVNGLSGKVDARVTISRAKGAGMRIVQDGEHVLVIDERTGQVSRVDPAMLEIAETAGFGAFGNGLQLVTTKHIAYAVAPEKGTIQAIDPGTLASTGPAIQLPGPLGEVVADESGALWVPVIGNGRLVQVSDHRTARSFKVAEADERFALTLAAGVPVITNLGTGTATIIGPEGPESTISLPGEVTQAGEDVAVPASTEGTVVPVLAGESLLLIDTGTGGFTTTALKPGAGGHELGTPQAVGRRIYLPDQTTGSLIVYDAAAARFLPDLRVARPGRRLEVFVKDGLLWANDPLGKRALVVDDQGRSHNIGKDDRTVPDDKRKPKSDPIAEPRQSRTPEPQEPQPSATPRPRRSPKPKPKPKPEAPGPPTGVTARTGDGYVDVSFSPSQGGEKPSGYRIRGAGDLRGDTSLGPDGPFSVRLTGGDCSRSYSFRVVAVWSDGEVASDPTASVRPCTAPASATNVKPSATKQGAKVTWSAPANADGITYDVSCDGPASGSQKDVSGTSVTLANIWTNGRYTCEVTSKNAAGTGKAATATADLKGPDYAGAIRRSGKSNTYVRSAPDPNSSEVYTYNDANGTPVTVDCQVQGVMYSHPDGAYQTDKYVHITDHPGYVVKYLVESPGDYNQLVGPELWKCK